MSLSFNAIAAPLLRADRQAFQVSHSLLAALLLLATALGGKFLAEPGSYLKKAQDQFI